MPTVIGCRMIWILAAVLLLSARRTAGNGCSRGTFWEPNSSQCKICPPGTYQSATNATSCVPCWRGTYLPFPGAQTPEACRKCPVGTFSSFAGSSSCAPCPQGTFSSEGFSRCVSCPKGTIITTFAIRNGTDGCERCWGGYADEENMLRCKPCPPGYSSPRGATSIAQCSPCPPGTASLGYGQCHACQHGSFAGEAGTPRCIRCATGSVPEKMYGSTKCVPCEPGQYGKVAPGYSSYISVCRDCPNNTKSYAPGAGFCRHIDGPCPRGYLQTSAGDCVRCRTDEKYDVEEERCVSCPRDEGSVGGLPLKCALCADVIQAEVRNSKCISWHFNGRPLIGNESCAAGSRIYTSNYARFCSKCDAGFFSSEVDSSECVPCPSGTVSSEGASSCEACPEGMVPDGPQEKCVVRETNCAPGTYLFVSNASIARTHCVEDECALSEDGSSYSCPPCFRPYRGYFDLDGCEACPGNEVRDYDGDCGCRGPLAQNVGMINGTCSTCPEGSYGTQGDAEEQNKCVKCPAGTFRAVLTMERLRSSACYRCSRAKPCEKCPAGFVSRHDGAALCEKCPAGTFSYGAGDTECLRFGAASAPVAFNDPLDAGVQAEEERYPFWWDV